MQVRVLFFGMLADAAGRRSDRVTLPAEASLDDLLAHYRRHSPELARYLPSLALSVNQEYAHPSHRLRDNDEVALLPPVSGGSPSGDSELAPAASTLTATAAIRITRGKIDSQKIADALKRPADGACAIFEGIVRDHSRGRQTLYLDYEAYEPMALTQMQHLASQAIQKFRVRDVAIIHRLGRLEIGETSVLIAVASAHRAAAFDACRWLIDTLKQTVPIWKKEYFQDGAVWADGEPFPQQISAAGDADGKPPAASK
jgi:molybdopterin synthase catalytic subunit